MKSNGTTSLLISAALAGIFTISGGTLTAHAESSAVAKPEQGLCKGANSCSGTSVWGPKKGKNGCQGEGYAFLSKAECHGKKLSWKPMPRKHGKPGGSASSGT